MMKKIIKISSLVLVLLFCLVCVACNDSDNLEEIIIANPKAKDLTTYQVALDNNSKNDLTLQIGETKELSLDSNSSSNVLWMSSNTKVVLVANGKITALSAGTATVTVVCNDDLRIKDSIIVTVIEKEEIKQEKIEKHLLTDYAGNYGGTLHASLYGEGAPKNGELDHEDSIYYAMNDYYNLKCTETRTIIPQLAVYEQTMANSDAIACAITILNHDGEKAYNEVELVKKYEELNKTVLYQNGATPNGIVKLFESLGYTATSNTGENVSTQLSFKNWVKKNLEEGNYILVPYQDNYSYRYKMIIGIETFETDNLLREDVLIFANPYDAYDHYQDGYSVESLARFFKWWRQVDEAGNDVKYHEYVIVTSKKGSFNLEKSDTDLLKITSSAPERHLLLNKDGSFGGTYNESIYGSITELNGGITVDSTFISNEHTDYNYYAFPDYYNLDDTETRYLLNHYQAFEQTMASSCGICSTLSVLNYYGYDFTNINSYIVDATFGNVDSDDNGKKQEALVKIYMQGDTSCTSFNNYGGVGSSTLSYVSKTLGFDPTYGRYYRSTFTSSSDRCFVSFDDFKTFVINNLQKDTPICVSWCPVGGHWEVIIGYETCGTESTLDDVIILADSHDVADHYQDGYNTLPAHTFYAQWYNSSGSTNQSYVVFENKKAN